MARVSASRLGDERAGRGPIKGRARGSWGTQWVRGRSRLCLSNCNEVSPREDVTESGSSIRSPERLWGVLMGFAGLGGPWQNLRGGWRTGMVSGQWKIRGVGSTGDPGPWSGVWEARRRPARGASPLGRGGAARPEPNSKAETWARTGCRAAERLGGSYLGLRRGGHRSPLLFGGSCLPPSAPGSGGRWQRRPRPPRVGRFREGGPSSLTVRASGRCASPALSERLRPAWAGTSPAAPRPESTRWTAASTAASGRLCRCSYCLRRRLSRSWLSCTLSTATVNRRRVPCPLRPRAPDPAHATPPRATPRLQASRRARTYLPRPLLPARVGPARSRPVPPPHVTPPERTACACADTPHFLGLRPPRPNFSSSPYGRAGNSALDSPCTGEGCRKVGEETSGFATVAVDFRPIQRCLKAGWGGEARGR